MTNKEKSREIEKQILDLEKKFNIKLYAANCVIWQTIGGQEVLPMIKFKFLEEQTVEAEKVDMIKK